MDDWFWYIWVVVVVVPLVFIAVQIIRYRGVRGAMLRGRIEKTFGELEFDVSFAIKSRIRVHRLSSETGAMIGMEVAKSGLCGFDMTPFRMTRDGTKDLIALLGKAIEEE